jgi:hypothetical protein
LKLGLPDESVLPESVGMKLRLPIPSLRDFAALSVSQAF